MNDNAPRSTRPLPTPAGRDDTVLDWARDAGAAELLACGLERYLRRRRRRRITFASTTCALLLVAGGASWFSFRERASPDAPPPATIASATILRPEQRILPDGSTVDLNAGAEIEVTFVDSLRRVVLHKGEAHFQVTKDAQRPFVVTAGAIEVRAVGTAFAVDVGTSGIDVLVTEGSVAVNTSATSETSVSTENKPSAPPPPPLAALEAGKRIIIEHIAPSAGRTAPRVSELSSADIQARLAWRVPRLKFAATPLADVVTMFNEHAVAGRDARLVLTPGMPANLRVSGMLRADDVDSLLRLLAGEFGISAARRGGEIVLQRP